jgi:hypothetical protein
MTKTGTTSRRVTLSAAERFDLWGERVVRMTLPKDEALTWNSIVALYGPKGLIGSVRPMDSAQVMNALTSRGIL